MALLLADSAFLMHVVFDRFPVGQGRFHCGDRLKRLSSLTWIGVEELLTNRLVWGRNDIFPFSIVARVQ
jgi:hypothetical protein